VGFVSDDNDILPRTKLGHRLAFFRHELVNGGKHHAAAGAVQQFSQVLAPLGLHGRLAEYFSAAMKLTEKLVIEVV